MYPFYLYNLIKDFGKFFFHFTLYLESKIYETREVMKIPIIEGNNEPSWKKVTIVATIAPDVKLTTPTTAVAVAAFFEKFSSIKAVILPNIKPSILTCKVKNTNTTPRVGLIKSTTNTIEINTCIKSANFIIESISYFFISLRFTLAIIITNITSAPKKSGKKSELTWKYSIYINADFDIKINNPENITANTTSSALAFIFVTTLIYEAKTFCLT